MSLSFKSSWPIWTSDPQLKVAQNENLQIKRTRGFQLKLVMVNEKYSVVKISPGGLFGHKGVSEHEHA